MSIFPTKMLLATDGLKRHLAATAAAGLAAEDRIRAARSHRWSRVSIL